MDIPLGLHCWPPGTAPFDILSLHAGNCFMILLSADTFPNKHFQINNYEHHHQTLKSEQLSGLLAPRS